MDASQRIKEGFTNVQNTIQVNSPANMPDLSAIGRACPKSAVYSYFNPEHRAATNALADIFRRELKNTVKIRIKDGKTFFAIQLFCMHFIEQRNPQELLSMSSFCRDSDRVNPKVWLNAFASTLLNRSDTRMFRMPALWEVIPDEFFSTFCIKQASRERAKSERDRVSQ